MPVHDTESIRILGVISNGGTCITGGQLAKRTGISERTVRDRLDVLQRRGLLSNAMRPGQRPQWKVTKAGQAALTIVTRAKPQVIDVTSATIAEVGMTSAPVRVPYGDAAALCGYTETGRVSEAGELAAALEDLRLLREDHADLLSKGQLWRQEAEQARRLAGQLLAAQHRAAELEAENAALRPRCDPLVPGYPVDAIVAALGSTVVMADPVGRGGTKAMMAGEITALRAELDQERAERKAEAGKLRAELRALQRILYGKRDAGAERDPRWTRAAEGRRLQRERRARWEATGS